MSWVGNWTCFTHQLVVLELYINSSPTAPPLPHQSNWDQVVEKFDDMNLREDLLRGIYAYG